MLITAHDRQCLLDLALQAMGSVEAALTIAQQNDLPFTASLAEGTQLEVTPHILSTQRDVAVRHAAEGVHPATDLSARDAVNLAQEGIEFMGIEIDFVVS